MPIETQNRRGSIAAVGCRRLMKTAVPDDIARLMKTAAPDDIARPDEIL
jgi:hypothetical protein